MINISLPEEAIDPQEILDHFNAVKTGETIPADGVTQYFYDHMGDAGDTIYLITDSELYFFHLGLEHEYHMANFDSYKVIVDDMENETRFIIFIRGDEEYTINLNFLKSDQNSIRTLRKIQETGTLYVHFLSLVFGGFIKEFSKEFVID